MLHPAIRPRRMFRGTGVSAAAANNFVGLFNNSTGAEVLVVRNFCLYVGTVQQGSFFSQQGKLGALVMAGVPVWSGEAAGPGQIFNGANGTITPDFAIQAPANGASALWSLESPIAIIEPGWTFGMSTGAGAVAINVSFLWQVALASELYPDS